MLLAASSDAIERAAELIRSGDCVAFPTETVYGLGADATNPRAVARVFEAKQRPSFDPLIVHVASADSVEDLVDQFPDPARLLMSRFWPGPLTIVLPKKPLVPDIVTAGLPSVALRSPDHPVANALLRRSGRPIAAPSANPFGYISPTRAQHVIAQLGDRIPLVLDGRACRVGIESTIVSLAASRPTILRHGAITRQDLEAHLGPVDEPRADADIQAPGQLPRHYAPNVDVCLVSTASEVDPSRRGGSALLSPGPVADTTGFARVEILSKDADLVEAAARLFETLRNLDRSDIETIYAILPSEDGIGKAIADRLRRAAHR